MTLGGMLRGIGLILFIAALAGVIAYIGDRVGHQVGRKRLTIFNIRPRYTSTIIAVGTGMVIALVITLIAIFASAQVQTAFFHLNEINQEIARAQARASALEQKYGQSPVVVNVNSLMSPIYGHIPKGAPSALRRQIVRDFYAQSVASINQQYTGPPYDLKRFTPPPDLESILTQYADDPKMQAYVSASDVLLLATASQNLYPRDQIHFGITSIPDRVMAPAGQAIASLVIPAGRNADAQLAIGELCSPSGWVPRVMMGRLMVPEFAANVDVQRMLPEEREMQRMLRSTSGRYIMTAFAAQDIYQHTFKVPVVVTLQKVPG